MMIFVLDFGNQFAVILQLLVLQRLMVICVLEHVTVLACSHLAMLPCEGNGKTCTVPAYLLVSIVPMQGTNYTNYTFVILLGEIPF